MEEGRIDIGRRSDTYWKKIRYILEEDKIHIGRRSDTYWRKEGRIDRKKGG